MVGMLPVLFIAESPVPSMWYELSKYLLNEWKNKQTLIAYLLCVRCYANHY